MADQLNQLMADGASSLVEQNFTGIRAEWWWERRMGGGIEVCQELDPEAMVREISGKTSRKEAEVRRISQRELGIEDMEPLVLTFEVSGDLTTDEVAALLAEHSREPEGLAASLYRKIERAVSERED